MTTVVSDRAIDQKLSERVLTHIDRQLECAARMLGVVSEQGVAIRRRDIQTVVRLAGSLQVEMHRQEVLDLERAELQRRAGTALGLDGKVITVRMLAEHMDPELAHVARVRNGELKRMLSAIQREHRTNRALMQQELAFIDHLLRLSGGGGSGAYDSGADRSSRRPANSHTRKRVFDLEA